MNKSAKKLSVYFVIILMFCGILLAMFFSATGKTPTTVGTAQFIKSTINLDLPESGALYQPRTIKVDRSGSIFILDAGNNRILSFSATGRFEKQFGAIGQGPGDLLFPLDFDLDFAGKLYVLEQGNRRISIFDSSGRFLNSFALPQGNLSSVCVNSQSEILISNPRIDGPAVDVYDAHGGRIRSIGMVDPIYIEPFETVHQLATELLNQSLVKTDSLDNTYVFYYSRPLFRKFDRKGQLLLEKSISFREVENTREANETIWRSRKPQRNSFSSLHYLTDFGLIGDGRIMIKLNNYFLVNGKPQKDTANYFYVLDNQGNPLSRFITMKSIERLATNLEVFKFAIVSRNELVCSDFTKGVLFRIRLE
jgi:hypothetical protein